MRRGSTTWLNRSRKRRTICRRCLAFHLFARLAPPFLASPPSRRRGLTAGPHRTMELATPYPTVTLRRGDGIGPEIAQATLHILESAGAKLIWDEQLAGLTAVEQEKNPLPQRTIDSIEKNRLALKGPLATP